MAIPRLTEKMYSRFPACGRAYRFARGASCSAFPSDDDSADGRRGVVLSSGGHSTRSAWWSVAMASRIRASTLGCALRASLACRISATWRRSPETISSCSAHGSRTASCSVGWCTSSRTDPLVSSGFHGFGVSVVTDAAAACDVPADAFLAVTSPPPLVQHLFDREPDMHIHQSSS